MPTALCVLSPTKNMDRSKRSSNNGNSVIANLQFDRSWITPVKVRQVNCMASTKYITDASCSTLTNGMLRRTVRLLARVQHWKETPHWRKNFGNVRQVPRGYEYLSSKYRNNMFRMKKHRYTKRWRMKRYKIAALANTPFNRKIKLHMLPKLTRSEGASSSGGGLKSSQGFDVDGMIAVMDLVAEGVTSAAGATQRKPRDSRPVSKYM